LKARNKGGGDQKAPKGGGAINGGEKRRGVSTGFKEAPFWQKKKGVAKRKLCSGWGGRGNRTKSGWCWGGRGLIPLGQGNGVVDLKGKEVSRRRKGSLLVWIKGEVKHLPSKTREVIWGGGGSISISVDAGGRGEAHDKDVHWAAGRAGGAERILFSLHGTKGCDSPQPRMKKGKEKVKLQKERGRLYAKAETSANLQKKKRMVHSISRFLELQEEEERVII